MGLTFAFGARIMRSNKRLGNNFPAHMETVKTAKASYSFGSVRAFAAF